jgi:hypothetical protein
MQRVARIALVAFAFTAAAVSQVVRVPHTGRVLDKDKKPVPNAKVTLVSAGGQSGLDEGDAVRVDADAEGRFRAQLQPARSYVAWTTTPCDDEFAVSEPVDVGMLPIELIASRRKVEPVLRLIGLEPWREVAPLRVEIAVFDCQALTVRGTLNKSGLIVVPPLPDVSGEVRVFAKDALVHVATSLPHGNVPLPKLQRLKVRIADDKDQAIAKAVVERIVCGWSRGSPFGPRPDVRSYPVATTGDDGTAEILLALDKDPFKSDGNLMLFFRARHDGHAPGISGFTNQAFANGKLLEAKEANGVLPFVLTVPTAKPIQLITHEGQMPSVVQRVGYRKVSGKQPWMTAFIDVVTLPVRDGALPFEPIDRTGQDCVVFPCQSPPLPPGDPWQRCAWPMPLVLPASAVDKNELDLRDVLPLRLQVLDAGAGPAIGAHIFCLPAVGSAGSTFAHPPFAIPTRTDRSGRVALPVLPGKWVVMAVLDDGIAHTIVEAAPGLGPQTLQLRGFDRMHVRVVDAEGKPVEGVHFSTILTGIGGIASAEGEVLSHLSTEVSSWMVQRAVSDANGNADLPFLAMKEVQLSIQAQKDRRIEAPMRLEANDARVDIVLK